MNRHVVDHLTTAHDPVVYFTQSLEYRRFVSVVLAKAIDCFPYDPNMRLKAALRFLDHPTFVELELFEDDLRHKYYNSICPSRIRSSKRADDSLVPIILGEIEPHARIDNELENHEA